jgi:hypothetical protein
MRLIARKEQPPPGAQLRITDADTIQITNFAGNNKKGDAARSLPTGGRDLGRTPSSARSPTVNSKRQPDPPHLPVERRGGDPGYRDPASAPRAEDHRNIRYGRAPSGAAVRGMAWGTADRCTDNVTGPTAGADRTGPRVG